MSVIRLGLIGAGRWGRIYIRTIAALADQGITLAAVASRNGETAALVPPGCQVENDWRALIGRGDVDGVIVATPPARHADMAVAALDAGKPVLIEKPLTMDVAEAERIITHAAGSAAFAMVDHTHLFDPGFRALLEMLPTIGPVREIVGCAGNWGPFRADTPVLWDWGAHDAAMILAVMGRDPVAVEGACVDRRAVDGGTGEIIRLGLRFSDGATATTDMGTLMAAKIRRFEVRGQTGTLVYDSVGPVKLSRFAAGPAHGDGVAVECTGPLPLTRCVLDFAQAIAAGAPRHDSLDLGLRVVRILAAAG